MVQYKIHQLEWVCLHLPMVYIQHDLSFHSGLGLYCTALFKNPPDTSVCDEDTEDNIAGSIVKLAQYAFKKISGQGSTSVYQLFSGKGS